MGVFVDNQSLGLGKYHKNITFLSHGLINQNAKDNMILIKNRTMLILGYCYSAILSTLPKNWFLNCKTLLKAAMDNDITRNQNVNKG